MVCKAAGFTLIEAMGTLAIAALTLTIGLPTFSDALWRQRVATTLHLLSADMAMARSSALTRRSRVALCPRDEASGCSGDRNWSRGWLVFDDPDGNRRPDTASDILRASDAPAGSEGNLYLPASRTVLSYLPDGRSAGTNLSVHLCKGGTHLAKVVVNNLGRVRSQRARPGATCPYD